MDTGKLKSPLKKIEAIGCLVVGLAPLAFIVYLAIGFSQHHEPEPLTPVPPPKSSTNIPTPSGIPYWIRITSPLNSDIWHVGENVNIGWESNFPEDASFRIKLSRDGRDYPIVTTANTGAYRWTVTDQIIGSGVHLEFYNMADKYNFGYGQNNVYINISR